MFIFAILLIPITYIFYVGKLDYKDVYNFFIGLFISSILTIIFWALSTLINFWSMNWINKAVLLYLKQYVGLSLLFVFITIKKQRGDKLPTNSLVAGFITWGIIFSVALHYNERELYVAFLQPIFSLGILLFYINKDRIKFIGKDHLVKSVIFIMLPLLSLALRIMYEFNIILFVSTTVLILLTVLFILFNIIKVVVKENNV